MNRLFCRSLLLLLTMSLLLSLGMPAFAAAPVKRIRTVNDPFAPLNVTGLIPAADAVQGTGESPEDPFLDFKEQIVAQLPAVYAAATPTEYEENGKTVTSLCGEVSAENTSGYTVPMDTMSSIFLNLVYDYPEATWNMRTMVGWYYPQNAESWMPGETVTLILYFFPDVEKEAFDAAVDAAEAACFAEGMTDFEKALSAHEWLATHIFYDPYVSNGNQDYTTVCGTTYPSDLVVYSPYGAFVNGKAVCQGYAMAYKVLMDRARVPCCYVTSRAMNHAWNMVQLDGAWYQVDVTWDDHSITLVDNLGNPVETIGDLAGYSDKSYFLRSDADFNQLLSHSGWTTEFGYECPENYTLPEALDRSSPPVFLHEDSLCVVDRQSDQLIRCPVGSDLAETTASWACPAGIYCAALWDDTLYLRGLTDTQVYAAALADPSAEIESAYTADADSRGLSAGPHPEQAGCGQLSTWQDYEQIDAWTLGEAHTDETMTAVLYYPMALQSIEDLTGVSVRLETAEETAAVYLVCYTGGRMTGLSVLDKDEQGNLQLPETLPAADADTVKLLVVSDEFRVLASPLELH